MAGADFSARQQSACPLDRYLIDDLASQLKPFLPGTDVRSIAVLLESDVNDPADKVASNLKDQFTAEDSISGHEAYLYGARIFVQGTLHEGSPASRLAEGLFAIYYGGVDPLRVLPPPRAIAFRRCHDGDTCTIVETQDAGCRVREAVSNVRVSGIDAPEVGVYYGPWVNAKLVQNVDALRKEWLGDAWLPKKTYVAANKLIATVIDYTGRLAALIRNDINAWNGAATGAHSMEESEIAWVWQGAGDQTPPILCGTWQPYDKYARRLGSFSRADESYFRMYLAKRLPELMATKGREAFLAARDKVRPLLHELRSSRKPEVQRLVRLFANGLADPAAVFSASQCAAMARTYEAFASAHGAHDGVDDQILQILAGSVHGYEKYRNQDGDVYQRANDIARREGVGLWAEPTFRTLYEIKERDARNHPPHCDGRR